MRAYFFGPEASTIWNLSGCKGDSILLNYRHPEVIDIRYESVVIANRFMFSAAYGTAINLIVHAAAQPSPDWAAREPQVDFDVNAAGTLRCSEAARKHCPKAVSAFTSTNKVYGDTPNRLPLVERETRWEIDQRTV